MYVTRAAPHGLLVFDGVDGRAWLRARGFPAFLCKKRGGFLIRPSDLPDIRAVCQHEHVALVEHRASGPRQARIRRHHAITRRRAA